jgi:hypothetical protein
MIRYRRSKDRGTLGPKGVILERAGQGSRLSVTGSSPGNLGILRDLPAGTCEMKQMSKAKLAEATETVPKPQAALTLGKRQLVAKSDLENMRSALKELYIEKKRAGMLSAEEVLNSLKEEIDALFKIGCSVREIADQILKKTGVKVSLTLMTKTFGKKKDKSVKKNGKIDSNTSETLKTS